MFIKIEKRIDKGKALKENRHNKPNIEESVMLEQKEWERLNATVNDIYKIENRRKMRQKCLENLKKLVYFDFSDFEIGLCAENYEPSLVDAVVLSKFSKKTEEEFMDQYEQIYHKSDYVKWVFTSENSLVYRESDLISKEARENSVFFKEYLEKFNLVHVAGISIINQSRFLGAITLYRSAKKGDFSDKDIYILKQLLPHLQTRLCESKGEVEKKGSYLLIHRYHLTQREIEVVEAIYRGDSNGIIGTQLSISEHTVKKHISNIFDKLEVNSRTLLIKFIIDKRLL